MKWLFVILLSAALVGCDNKKDETEQQRKEKLGDMYRTPPPADRSKDKGF